MKSLIFKRSIVVGGHKTSISLEDEFWESLREIADQRHQRLNHLIAEIDEDRRRHFGNLSSAIRLFILRYYRDGRENGMAPLLTQERLSAVKHIASSD